MSALFHNLTEASDRTSSNRASSTAMVWVQASFA